MYNTSICFEDILDNCIVAIRELGRTVDDCLARYPDQRAELEPLLRLTVRLQAARTLQAPPDFRRTAAARMHNLVASRPRRAERTAIRTNPLRHVWSGLQAAFRLQKAPATVVVGVVVALLLLVGGGTVYAAADALPGDALYPVKIAVETVQLAVSLNDARDAELHLSFAARRLEEAAASLAQDRPGSARQALTDYASQLESALAFFDRDSRLSPEAQVMLANQLVARLPRHEAQLAALLEQSPETDRSAIELALTVSQTGRSLALEVVSGEPGEPDLPVAVPTGPFFTSPLSPTHTLAPTWTPTQTPTSTSTPTQTPTVTPSLSPARPTSTPWPEPSILTPWPRPTRRPTNWPTGWPTGAPPGWPTEIPWPPPGWPTAWPTAWPTGWPTAWPTEYPTEWPTEWPMPSAPPERTTPRLPPRVP